MTDDFNYQGKELELFQFASNWKAYFKSQVQPYIQGRVLEVGAGIGATTTTLCSLPHTSWTCLEPDQALGTQLLDKVKSGALPDSISLEIHFIDELDEDARFDTILYIDVLEHIEQDKLELNKAAAKLAPGGFLCVLSPAHQFLFSPFDAAIGHFRRYNKSSILALQPPETKIVSLKYLDCVGMFASLGNRLLLRQTYPELSQIQLWDKWMVPVSRVLDPMFGFNLGKSILAIWQKA